MAAQIRSPEEKSLSQLGDTTLAEQVADAEREWQTRPGFRDPSGKLADEARYDGASLYCAPMPGSRHLRAVPHY
ncbi:MAG: hypothetical protein JO081_11685 [Alphaproteobacteria bacterium]|nr:hypothetical protein [Alphaproteobacteria bacterium]